MPRAKTLPGALAGQLNRNVMPQPAPLPGTYAGLVDALGGPAAAAKYVMNARTGKLTRLQSWLKARGEAGE